MGGGEENEAAESARITQTIHRLSVTLPWLFNNSSNIIVIEQFCQVAETYNSGHRSSSSSGDDSSLPLTVVGDEEKEIDQPANVVEPFDEGDSITIDEEEKEPVDQPTKVKESFNEEDDEEEIIRRRLTVRAYHLPGNNWYEDWKMYIQNNHLVFGLCFHHPIHPVKNKHRLILLSGSLAFGLAVTNLVYLLGDFVNDTVLTDNVIASWGDKIYNETEQLLIVHDITVLGQGRVDTTHVGMLWTLGEHDQFSPRFLSSTLT